MTQPDRAPLIHILRLAAPPTTARMAGVAGVLMRQAAEARAIADRLEAAKYVRIGREVE